MTRVAISAALLLLLAALCALLTGSAHAFQISAAPTKVPLTSSGAVQLELLVTPPQSELAALTIETIVDTEGKTIASDLQAKGDGTKFVAAVEALRAGLYKMKVSGEDAATKEAVYEVVPFRVTVPAEIAEIKVNGNALPSNRRIDSPVLSSAENDGLIIEVSLQNKLDKTPLHAHQAFLRFSHAEDKTETYFVLPFDAETTAHKIVLGFASLSKKFSYKSGQHTMELILGDAKFEQAIVRDLGSVELLLAAAPPVAPSPLYAKPLLHESDTTLKALKEIKHVMRSQDPRPPLVVSLAFTAAVLLPLLGFFLYVLKLQLNISKLFSGSVAVFGVLFLLSVAATFVLFAFYWLQFTMFQTLGYLAVLSIFTLGSGHLTLKQLAQQSVSAKAKKE